MGRRSFPTTTSVSSSQRQGTLQQLNLLRSFVPAEMGFSEGDLTDCLRQCGFNVNTAAEKLITGEYKKQKGVKGAFLKMTAVSPDRKFTSRKHSATSIPRSATGKRKSAPALLETKEPPRKSPSTSMSSGQKSMPIDLSMDDGNAENHHNKSTPKSTTKVENKYRTKSTACKVPEVQSPLKTSSNPPGGWLLCQRWISDAICTSRCGTVDYRETLSTEPSGPTFLRLRGRSLEGRLPDHIGRLLNPLLRENLVSLEAQSLMREKNLRTGASIPVSLSVYLPDPRAFFQVFRDSSSLTDSTSNVFLNKQVNSKARRRMQEPLEKAAFDLLQWAQHGDVPDFKAEKDPEEIQEDGKDEELDENDFENDSEDKSSETAKKWSETITSTDRTAQLPECEEPPGLRDVQLRPYQKQALHWMRQREIAEISRKEQEEQLAILAELARSKASSTATLPANSSQDIVCDCGPVQVSESAKERAKTCDGDVNPVSHPLWQRRFLTDPNRENLLCFFVNELMGIASHQPASPPQPCSGGILADAMGLGKTVMLLSLILKAKQEKKKGSLSATLVVAKLSLLPQWEDEIKTKTNLTFAVYYGAQASREYTVPELENVDVVLTTYGTMQGEMKRKNPLLTKVKWLRVILDEAHCVRNQTTLASKACCALQAEHRWAVSGTIMMNSMQDLFGILKFLRHEPWCLTPFWKAAITKPMLLYENSANEDNDGERNNALQLVLGRLRRVLAPIMLRRTKDSLTSDGEPILTLPPVENKTIYVDLSPTEREFYQAILARSLEIFDGFVDAGTAAKSYLQILSMISRLRQCCDHISLTVRNRFDDEEFIDNSNDQKICDGSDLGSPKCTEKTEEDVLGKEFMEGLMMKLSGSPRRKSKSISVEESPTPTKALNVSFLQSVASTLSQAVERKTTHTTEECPICLDQMPITATVMTPCGHLFCKDCLVEYFKENASDSQNRDFPDGSCPVCNNHVSSDRIVSLSASREDPDRVVTKYLTDPSPTTTPIKAKRSSSPTETAPSARTILQDAIDGREDSSKMKAVLSELQNIWKLDPGSKVLIFSQFLGFLDLLQPRLASMGVPYYRLDGQMSLPKRVDVLKEFRSSTVPSKDTEKGCVLLMSMNAGAEGLNLVSASTVFLVDSWWNTAKEDQCINRVVRLGQTAPLCRVRKFVVRHSVEERIVELQSRKKYMADELYETVGRDGSAVGGGASRLTLEDLQILFQS